MSSKKDQPDKSKDKDIKATQSWDDFESFASNLMQVTPEDVKEVEKEDKNRDDKQPFT